MTAFHKGGKMEYEKMLKEREAKAQEVTRAGKPLPKLHALEGKRPLLHYFVLWLDIHKLKRVLKKK